MPTKVYANHSIGISDLKKNPMGAVEAAGGEDLVVLNRNKPAFYCVTPERFAAMLKAMEDIQNDE